MLWPPKKPTDPPAKDRFGWTGPRGGSVGVPGEPAGLELLSRKFGKRSLSDVAAPAVALAQNGFYASKHTAETAALFKERVQTLPSLASSFLPGGVPATMAARIRRPELAATLFRFGAEGKKSIYEGATAQKIVDAAHAAGGTMTTQDLASYSVKERAPLSRIIDGRTVYTMPAPSAGGLMLLEALSMYGASRSSALVPLGFGSSAYLHTVAEVMRGAFADRARIGGRSRSRSRRRQGLQGARSSPRRSPPGVRASTRRRRTRPPTSRRRSRARATSWSPTRRATS